MGNESESRPPTRRVHLADIHDLIAIAWRLARIAWMSCNSIKAREPDGCSRNPGTQPWRAWVSGACLVPMICQTALQAALVPTLVGSNACCLVHVWLLRMRTLALTGLLLSRIPSAGRRAGSPITSLKLTHQQKHFATAMTSPSWKSRAYPAARREEHYDSYASKARGEKVSVHDPYRSACLAEVRPLHADGVPQSSFLSMKRP